MGVANHFAKKFNVDVEYLDISPCGRKNNNRKNLCTLIVIVSGAFGRLRRPIHSACCRLKTVPCPGAPLGFFLITNGKLFIQAIEFNLHHSTTI